MLNYSSSQNDSLANSPLFSIDSTAASVIHKLFANRTNRSAYWRAHCFAIAVTFLPLLVLTFAMPNQGSAFAANSHRLTFANDWNILFTYLLSFPCILGLAVTDQNVLASSLETVQLDGTLIVGKGAASLSDTWRKKFRNVNMFAQLLGTAIGFAVSYINYIIYRPVEVGYWIADDQGLLPIGYAYLCSIFLLYFVVTIYVLRNLAIALFLKDVVAMSELHLLPLHPDDSAGLYPIGRLGLRNQYVLMLLGINIVLVIGVTITYLRPPPHLYELIAVAIAAYLVLGPLVFLAPLLPFREGMLKTKVTLQSEVAQRIRVELQNVRRKMKSGEISKADEELIDRLRKMAAVIRELPVWPFT